MFLFKSVPDVLNYRVDGHVCALSAPVLMV